MEKAIPLLCFALLWPVAKAQVYGLNAAGVSLSQWHLLEHDVEPTKNFWMHLGGAPIKIDGTDVIKFPGVLIFLSPGSPTAGTRGSTVNHVGLGSENVQQLFARLHVSDGERMHQNGR